MGDSISDRSLGYIALDQRDLKEAHERERHFQALYDHNPSMYFTLAPDGTVLSVNRYGAQMLGYEQELLVGRSVLTVFRPQDHDAVLGQIMLCTANPGQLFEWELQKVRRDGSALWVKERAQAIRDQNGRELVLVVCEDITTRRLTEDIVRESEERWRALFEHAAVGIAQLSLGGQFLRVNPRLCETLGYSSKTLLQRTLQELTHPDDMQPGLDTHLKGLLVGCQPSFSMEKRYRRSDDTWIWVNLTISVVGTTSCAPAYFIAIVEDISDRKASEARLRHFVSEAPVGLVILDNERRLLTANKAFCELTGYEEQELVGRTYDLYTHPDDLQRSNSIADDFSRGMRSGHTLEKRYVRKTGDTIWVSVKATSIELPNHAGPLLLAVVQDITDQKRATEEREQLSQDLHDNILQSLYAVGMQLEASRLAAGKSRRKSKVYAGQAIDQLNHLVADVREFIALLKQGRSHQMDLGGALHQLISAFSTAGHRPPCLTIQDGVLNLISAEQSEQLLNIAREALSNSVRHAQATDCSINIERFGHMVRLRISDNGIGFSPRLKRKQGHGLVNMAARAKKIGARLRLTSKVAHGTSVIVEFKPAQPA